MIFRSMCGGLALLCLLPILAAHAGDRVLRLGVLGFGTVAWELDTIDHYGLARSEGLDIQVRTFAGKQAAAIAFQGGQVDAIVTDLVWVARQRAVGRAIRFAPFSSTVGAIMVPAESSVQSIADLHDLKIGIAGGPLDKSWLLLRSLVQQRHGFDPETAASPTYGAPPLLQQQFARGQVDALVTFWHFAARLEAAGHRRLMDMNDVVEGLGGARDVALIGYVFAPDPDGARAEADAAFLRASRAAKALLLRDDEAWHRLRPKMRAGDDAAFGELKRRFRAGTPAAFGPPEVAAARRLFDLLATAGGTALVGEARELDTAAFHPAAFF
ncbi:MAG: ABC transporter substrate-binding protein [Minwuia sp.]|nr:ABC transporter substrate-binding protein [Minwuia sp.]